MIRQFHPDDLDAVMQLWLHSNVQAHEFISTEYWEGNFAMVKEMLPSADLYVYENKGTIVAFAGLQDEYLAGIFVEQNLRSHGIGKKLLDYCKEHRKTLSLCVYEKNQKAFQFYLREGFHIKSSGTDENTGEIEHHMVWER